MSVNISPTHGLNPSLECCFYCGEARGVVVFGRIALRHKKKIGEELYNRLKGAPDDLEAPRDIVIDREPCDTCKSYMEKGVILISVSTALTTDKDNPYRTGGFAVLTEAGVRRCFHDCEQMLKARIAFVEDEIWDQMGLPKGEARV